MVGCDFQEHNFIYLIFIINLILFGNSQPTNRDGT